MEKKEQKKKPAAKKTTAKKTVKKKSPPKPKKETREEKIARETAERKAITIKAYEKKGGNVAATCEAANIGRRTFYLWKETDPEFAEAIKDLDESLLDFAESKLMEKVQDGDLTAIIFTLKTKGKDRGYVERSEQNVTMNPFIEAMQGLPDPPQE